MQAFSASRADKDFSDPNDVLNGFSLREAPASEEEWSDRYIIFMSPEELIRNNERMRFPDYAVNEAVNRVLQHPKVEFLDGLIYGVLNRLDDARNGIVEEELTFFFCSAGIVVISETSELTDSVKRTILAERTEQKRKATLPERALFLLMERIAAADIALIRRLDEEETVLEERLLAGEKLDYPREIFRLRQKTLQLTQYVALMVDMSNLLEEEQSVLIRQESARMFRLIGSRLDRLERAASALRESVIQLREAYQAQVDIDANLMMRLFTVVSVIFLPLTVITGWFGMNFRDMPELEWKFGYPAVAIVSALVTIGIIWFCKRRKYL